MIREMPKLVFLNRSLEKQEYELVVERTTVGRGNHNTVVLSEVSVSLTHCEILMCGSEIILRDLDSSNGTFVDEIRVNPESPVKSGQVMRFGLVEARLVIEAPREDPAISTIAVGKDPKRPRQKRKEA